MTSQLIGRLCDGVVEATQLRYGDGPLTRHGADLVITPEAEAEMLILKGIAVHFLMAPRERRGGYRQQRERLAALVLALEARGADAMEPHFAEFYEAASSDAARKRVAVDQVASLTDKSAHDWFHRFVAARR
jgi:dGTPase